MFSTTYDSPIGNLTLAREDSGLRHIIFPSGCRSFDTPQHWQSSHDAFDDVKRQLDEYFEGKRKDFSIPLAPIGTPFQQSVWKALCTVAYSTTCSYGAIAKQIGKPTASRAVGAANGANPIPIIIPCHRVIGSSGRLTGFGGGLATKAWLLAHERGEGQLFAFTNP
ncbi:MAG: methylated-DNA--[protein]-cysteine S-methyltransferase [Granulosicoccus sp.]